MQGKRSQSEDQSGGKLKSSKKGRCTDTYHEQVQSRARLDVGVLNVHGLIRNSYLLLHALAESITGHIRTYRQTLPSETQKSMPLHYTLSPT